MEGGVERSRVRRDPGCEEIAGVKRSHVWKGAWRDPKYGEIPGVKRSQVWRDPEEVMAGVRVNGRSKQGGSKQPGRSDRNQCDRQ